MAYLDGFLIPIKKRNLKAYRKMALLGKKTWMKHGALDYEETVGDALDSKWGTPFPLLMKLKSGEILIFAFIVLKSRAHRDKVNAKVMKELSEAAASPDMPYDMKRLVYGGFKVLVDGK